MRPSFIYSLLIPCALAACTPATPDVPSAPSYALGGTVSGLEGDGLILRNGDDKLTISATGTFVFAHKYTAGSPYDVTVESQPEGPSQTCSVVGGKGTVGATDITSLSITCVTNEYSVSGTITGLAGSGLKLRNNGGDETAVTQSGPFGFSIPVKSGAGYAVTVIAQPTNVIQHCDVMGGNGTVTNGPITDVLVVCTTTPFPVGGTVSGLVGTLVLQLGDESLPVTMTDAFTFDTPVDSGASYEVLIKQQPEGQTCAITNGSGVVVDHAINSIQVSCSLNPYTVGGTVSGLLPGGAVTLQLGEELLGMPLNGAFTFPTPQLYTSNYDVTVAAQPEGQTCQVTNGMGTVPGKNVTTIEVSCSVHTFAISGTVSGLSAGGSVTLQIDAANQVTVNSNTTFAFPQPTPYGTSYDISVASQPEGQTCTALNGKGTMPDHAVANVTVSCVVNTFTVGGALSGLLPGSSLTLQASATNQLTLTSNGNFTFPKSLPYKNAYDVTVVTPPTGQDCVVTLGSGTVTTHNVTDIAVTCTPKTYLLGGSVNGLIAGTSVTIQTDAVNQVTISSNTTFNFPISVANGTHYSVTVATHPDGVLLCGVTNASGVMPAADVSNIVVNCAAITYIVTGAVSGLLPGGSVTLALDALSRVTVTSNTAFELPATIPVGGNYSVTVAQQPTGQTCTVSNGSGTITAGAPSNVQVTCTTKQYRLGGTVTGLLSGNSVKLGTDASNAITVSANGSFVLPSRVTYQGSYAVTALTQPTGQTCVVTNGVGTMPGADVTDLLVRCAANTYSVGGTVRSLYAGTQVTLQTDASNQITVSSMGSFTLPIPLPYKSTYTVSVSAQPVGQVCSVISGTGTIGTTSVTDVKVDCVFRLYTVGGTVSGLNGDSDIILRNVATQPMTNAVTLYGGSTSGNFAFPYKSEFTSSYDVQITRQPDLQTCTVQNGAGVMPAGDVTDISVSCVCNSGYTYSNGVCADINECAQNATLCGTDPCSNTPGGYVCRCLPGYVQNGSVCEGRFTSFSVGDTHACALRNDGSLWCWGQDIVVGVGDFLHKRRPTQVGTSLNWASVSAGPRHTCGRRADGTLWCWGANDYGQIGDGTTSSRYTPVQVGTDTNWVEVWVGGNRTCGKRADGTLWCWGANGGTLGDGTQTNRPTPVQIGTATNWRLVSVGYYDTCATQVDGTLWCWGDNTAGQLGDGTQTNRSSPT